MLANFLGVFHSFYEIQSEFPISVTTKNLFLSLPESITQTLKVTLCYVCGGKNMRPLAMGGKRAKPTRAHQGNHFPSHRESIWLLKTSIIGITVALIQKANSPPDRGLGLLGTKVLQ
jgi:hypothetical protein